MVRVLRLSVVILSFAVLGGTIVRAQTNPLVNAAQNADLPGVLQLIEAGADVNQTSGDGSTAMLWAAYHFNIDMAQALVEAGAIVDIANDFGVTPLLQAARTGDAAMIRLLLEAGAHPHQTHLEGETPLMAAALTGSTEAVEALIGAGADVNATDNFQNQTALMWAAAEGHADVVDMLLEAGADPDHQAHISTLTSRRNADHPTGGFSALMWAARNGHEDAVRRLIAGGANPDLANGDGATAMMIAIYNDRFDMAATLMELGADVNDGSLYTAVEMRRSTTDQFAFDGSRLRPNHDNTHTALDLIGMLLERGADPHRYFEGQFHSTSMPNGDRFADSAFFRAAVSADVEALKVLLPYAGDIDTTLVVPAEEVEEETAEDAPAGPGGRGRGNANEGRTAAMAAMGGGRAPAMTGGPGYIRDGDAPYREPGSRDALEALRLLLEAGADPNAIAPDGNTLLHQAVGTRNLEIIQALADAGVEFEHTNEDGLTPLDIAEGRRPETDENEEEEAPAPTGPGGRGGPRPSPEVAGLLRELMGLPPAPPAEETEAQPSEPAPLSPAGGGE